MRLFPTSNSEYLCWPYEYLAHLAIINCNGVCMVKKVDIAVFTVLYHKLFACKNKYNLLKLKNNFSTVIFLIYFYDTNISIPLKWLTINFSWDSSNFTTLDIFYYEFACVYILALQIPWISFVFFYFNIEMTTSKIKLKNNI